MGAATSYEGASNRNVAFDLPEEWSLEHVKALHKAFKDGNLDFGMDKEAFDVFMLEALPAAAHTTSMYWRRFDTNNTGVINVIEVISGLAVMSQSSVAEKAEFIFELNDFNHQGNLSYDELVVLLYLACSSTVLISGKGVFPEEQKIEGIADEAFIFADIDMSSRIDLNSFKSWIFEFLGMSEETPTVGLREYLKRMKSLKHTKVAGQTSGQQGMGELEKQASNPNNSNNSVSS